MTMTMIGIHMPQRSGIYLLNWIFICSFAFKDVYGQVPAGCDGNVDLVFIVDSSESMIVNDPYGKPYFYWNYVKNFTKSVVNLLPVNDDTRVGVLQYADSTNEIISLQGSVGKTSIDIQDVISTKLSHLGGVTYTKRAMDVAKNDMFATRNGKRDSARQVAVVLTDGLSNKDMELTLDAAHQLRNDGVEIYAVGVTAFVDDEELRGIASDGTKYLLGLVDYTELDRDALILAHRICNIPEPTPSGPKTPDCEVKTDLVLMIDNSGSIRDKNPNNTPIDSPQDNYQLLRDFLIKLVERIGVGPDTTRVAAIRFSEEAKIEFLLNRYSSLADVKQAIQNIGYDGSFTNISGAIKLAKDEVFVEERGDRSDVRNVGVIITDGESNKDEHLTISYADEAKNEGIILFVVGITDKINEMELRSIASSPPSSHFFNSTNIENLSKIFTQLHKNICDPSAPVRYKRSVSTSSQCVEGSCSSKSKHKTVKSGSTPVLCSWTVLIFISLFSFFNKFIAMLIH